MKKSAIASAVLSALISGSALAANVYSADGTELSIGGRAEFRGDFTDAVEGTMQDKSRARLNVKGSTQISDGLSAFGMYEAEHESGSQEFTNRYLYAGINTNNGNFSVGRQDMAAVLVTDMTDITEFSGVQQYIAAGSDKEDSVFAYSGNFDALKLEATYQASDAKDDDAFSVAGMYSLSGELDLGFAYSADDADASQVLAGLGYTSHNLYIGGTFSTGDKSKSVKFTVYELSASYEIKSELSIAANYSFAEEEEANITSDEVDQFELAAYYEFNSSFVAYTAYSFNQISGADDVLRLAVRYGF